MMTTTDRLAAMIQIEKGIARDIANRPSFTLTRAQLMNRILDYCDRPDATTDDICAIHRTMITDPDLPLRD